MFHLHANGKETLLPFFLYGGPEPPRRAALCAVYVLRLQRCDLCATCVPCALLQGADLLAKDSEGRSALHHAVMHGHLGVVDLLLAKGGAGLLLCKDILNCTPVHLAAVQNQVRGGVCFKRGGVCFLDDLQWKRFQ